MATLEKTVRLLTITHALRTTEVPHGYCRQIGVQDSLTCQHLRTPTDGSMDVCHFFNTNLERAYTEGDATFRVAKCESCVTASTLAGGS